MNTKEDASRALYNFISAIKCDDLESADIAADTLIDYGVNPTEFYFLSCNNNAVNYIDHFLKKYNIDSNTKDGDGDNAYAYAMTVKDLALIHHLFYDLKVDINSRNTEGSTPLIIACLCDNAEVALELIKLGANCMARNNEGISALEILAHTHMIPPSELCISMLKSGADPLDLYKNNLAIITYDTESDFYANSGTIIPYSEFDIRFVNQAWDTELTRINKTHPLYNEIFDQV